MHVIIIDAATRIIFSVRKWRVKMSNHAIFYTFLRQFCVILFEEIGVAILRWGQLNLIHIHHSKRFKICFDFTEKFAKYKNLSDLRPIFATSLHKILTVLISISPKKYFVEKSSEMLVEYYVFCQNGFKSLWKLLRQYVFLSENWIRPDFESKLSL